MTGAFRVYAWSVWLSMRSDGDAHIRVAVFAVASMSCGRCSPRSEAGVPSHDGDHVRASGCVPFIDGRTRS